MTNEELVLRIKAGEKSLMDELWAQVCNFVYQQAHKFYNTYLSRCKAFGLEYEDIQQEGFLAVYKAVEGYQPEHEVVFLTYAGYCLKQAFFAITKMNYANWQNNAVRSCSLSLDAPVYSDNTELTLADTLEADNNLEDEVINKIQSENLTRDLKNAIGGLRESWQDVIYTVYFVGIKPAELARLEGVSRSVVSRKCRLALACLAKSPALQAYRV